MGAERLCESGIGAERRCRVEVERLLRGAASGNCDYLDVRAAAADIADGLYTFLVRHDDVGDHQVRSVLVDAAQARNAILRLDHRMAGTGENAADGLSHPGCIIDDEDERHIVPPQSTRSTASGPSRRASTSLTRYRTVSVVNGFRMYPSTRARLAAKT